MKKSVLVPIEVLDAWHARLMKYWSDFDDGEHGPVEGGLEGDISRGNANEISEMRKYIAKGKKNSRRSEPEK